MLFTFPGSEKENRLCKISSFTRCVAMLKMTLHNKVSIYMSYTHHLMIDLSNFLPLACIAELIISEDHHYQLEFQEPALHLSPILATVTVSQLLSS